MHMRTLLLGTSVATLVPPPAADCSNTRYVRDPVTKTVSVAGYAGEGTTETGARKAGAGGGGLTEGVFGAFLEGMDTGKIAKLPLPENPEFNAKLGQLARTAVPVEATGAQQ